MAELPNWFSNDGQVNFEFYLLPLAQTKQSYLQIGSYTGDASVWLEENILSASGSTLIDVDTWEGSEEPVHYQMNWHSVEDVYDNRTLEARNQKRIIKYKGTSDMFFKQNKSTFDFIYIDGDHTAYGVLKDAVNSFEVLNSGGILAFDDYQWSAGLGELKEPKPAIDAFWSVYKDKLEVLFVGYQCWFRKL